MKTSTITVGVPLHWYSECDHSELKEHLIGGLLAFREGMVLCDYDGKVVRVTFRLDNEYVNMIKDYANNHKMTIIDFTINLFE